MTDLSKGQIVIYENNGNSNHEVILEDNTLWLSAEKIAKLFGKNNYTKAYCQNLQRTRIGRKFNLCIYCTSSKIFLKSDIEIAVPSHLQLDGILSKIL